MFTCAEQKSPSHMYRQKTIDRSRKTKQIHVVSNPFHSNYQDDSFTGISFSLNFYYTIILIEQLQLL